MELQSRIDGIVRLFKQKADIDLLVWKRPMIPVTPLFVSRDLVSQPWLEDIRVHQNLESIP